MISLKSLLIEGTLNEDIKRDIDKFIDKLNKQFPDQEYTVSSGGGKYARITHKNRKGGQESAWGFIALVDNPSKGFQKGDLLKAAGYNTPAKNARGNILNGTAKYDKYSPAYLREEFENLVNEATVKLKKTISKQEWDRIPKYNKHIGQDGTKYIMQYSDSMGTYLQGVNVSDGKYYVGYNKGRGQGTGVFKDVFTSYDAAKKEVEKTEKLMKGGSNMTAYYVADKDGNPIRESQLKGYLAADVVDDIVKAIGSKMVKGHVENAPNRNYITDIKFGNDVVKMLKSKFGIDAKIDKTFGNIPTVSFPSKKVVSEAKSDYEVYHKSYTSAIEAARNYAEKKGYEINNDDAFTKIGVGPRKPSPGKTNRFSIELTKDGKPQRKMLHIQVYGMKNSYELNAYIQ
jgi:hypothetical protein